MVRFKKILAVFLAVCILTLSVSSSYKVEAASVAAGAALTAKTIFDICLFVGCAFVACYAVGEIIDNKDDIARAGKNFIDSITSIPEGWILSMTDASGQEYVFGSEALELVQETDWEVIQGGGGAGNNNDDDDDDKKNGWFDGLLNLSSSASELVGSFTALGSVWFYDTASKLYQKWVNGEELTEAEAAVIEPFVSGYCNQYDIAAQWSGESFAYDAVFDFSGYWGTDYRHESLHFSFLKEMPYAGLFDSKQITAPNGSTYTEYSFYIYFWSTIYKDVNSTGVNCQRKTVYSDGRISLDNNNRNGYSYNVGGNNWTSPSMSITANFPVFGSYEEVCNYLKGNANVEDSINYAKVWREADWLADDWQGLLVDPLANVGLSLSQFVDLAKALGLHAVGNDLTPSELADLIAESLPEVNPELLPDAVGVPAITPDPGLEPIYFPYPGAHPDINPSPNPNPDPNPSPNPNPNPGTETDIDMNDYKVNLTSVFPFCIPFDFITLLDVLDAEPVAPRFEFPVVIPALDYQETVIIDMSIFDEVAEIIRLCETISFIIFLMFATSKVIRW
ncbi:MAG: hypothetical protein K2N85_04580 [Lachnospiraceae bacterium]|nr:hypothetical protein [Lachnospiraceae bacterium]